MAGTRPRSLCWWVMALVCFVCIATTVFQNFLSLVPLALMLGGVTEDLALRFGDTVRFLLPVFTSACVYKLVAVSIIP